MPEHTPLGTFDMYVVDGRRRWVYRPFVSFSHRPQWKGTDDDDDDAAFEEGTDDADVSSDETYTDVAGDGSNLGSASKRLRRSSPDSTLNRGSLNRSSLNRLTTKDR